MLHSHCIRSLSFLAAFAVYALGNLHTYNIHGRNADCLLNAYRPAHANRNGVALERENLPEAPHVNPLAASCFCELITVCVLSLEAVFESFILLRTSVKAVHSVIAAVVGLNKNLLAHILKTIADFSLDADIGNLSVAVKALAGTVAVERVAVGVCIGRGDNHGKVNFVFKNTHNQFSSFFLLVKIISVV